jgi:hypothetical protein
MPISKAGAQPGTVVGTSEGGSCAGRLPYELRHRLLVRGVLVSSHFVGVHLHSHNIRYRHCNNTYDMF